MTTHALEFSIAFEGPFATASGVADRGADLTVGATGRRGGPVEARDPRRPRDVDTAELLPATRLKGLMRAAATQTLRLNDRTVEDVFGSVSRGSPWSWRAAEVDDAWIMPRAQVAIDPEDGTVVDGALLLAEEVWASSARFTVMAHSHVDDPETHTLVLRASAASVHALGRSRRRGLGWVAITPDSPVDASDVDRLRKLQGSR